MRILGDRFICQGLRPAPRRHAAAIHPNAGLPRDQDQTLSQTQQETQVMSRFTQHTHLVAAPGKRDELVAKFLESAEIQRDSPDCELMLVSTAPDSADIVYLTEVWSSEDAWEQVRRSAPIQAWAASMPALVSGPPESIPLEVVGGKGLG
jgi:quinol monooxygenase YgiN